MTEIPCHNCNELNDLNSVKCESCKVGLNKIESEEEDECERDFRFIEEAEFIGQVYKLENIDELEGNLDEHNIKYEPDVCFQIPSSCVESVVKLENNDDEEVTFEIVTVDPNQTKDDNDTNNDQIPILKVNTNTAEETAPRLQYPCTQCTRSFKRKASLKAHVDRMHNSDDSSDCGAGHESVTNRKPNNVPDPFYESCGSEYTHSENENEETSVNIKPSPTRRKRKPTHQSDSENNNSQKKSPNKKFKTEPSPCSNSKQNGSNEIVYKCAACEKITESYQEHLKHIVIHEKVDDSLTVTTSLEQLKKTPSGFLECKECGGVFMSEREYNIHQRSHQGVYQCDICKTILLTPSSLRKHKLRMHRQRSSRRATLFECNICNEKYESQLLMLQHRKKHTEVMKKIEEMTIIDRSNGKTSYVCKICAKTSNNKFRHEEHLRIHTKEKPYKCEKCGIGIATSNAMAHHMRTHENITFECNVCHATYRHKKSLKKHLKLHTGEKPFQCRHCDKTFVFNYTRADHERNIHVNGGTSRIQKRKRKNNSIKKIVENGNESKTTDPALDKVMEVAMNDKEGLSCSEEVDII